MLNISDNILEFTIETRSYSGTVRSPRGYHNKFESSTSNIILITCLPRVCHVSGGTERGLSNKVETFICSLYSTRLERLLLQPRCLGVRRQHHDKILKRRFRLELEKYVRILLEFLLLAGRRAAATAATAQQQTLFFMRRRATTRQHHRCFSSSL